MFTRVVKTLQQSEQAVIGKFLPRLRTIVHEAEGLGWGYYDAIIRNVRGNISRGNVAANLDFYR